MLPSPLPHSLFLPLSLNTYWIRWAAVGGGYFLTSKRLECCSDLQRSKSGTAGDGECVSVRVFWGGGTHSLLLCCCIQTHHRFSPQDLRWDFRCLWLVFSPKHGLNKKNPQTARILATHSESKEPVNVLTSPHVYISAKKREFLSMINCDSWFEKPAIFWNVIKCKNLIY